MKRLIILISFMLAGMDALFASDAIDSLSYAYGHSSTLMTMAGKNELMESRENFKDYIRGIEDGYGNFLNRADSSYLFSYALGSIEAAYVMEGIRRKEDAPPYSCIIIGLRKVGTGEINLPEDTVRANKIIIETDRFQKPDDLDEESRCRFFTAYGIMKAYQPGLQKYIDELKPGSEIVENRQAFATGMADVLEAGSCAPKTAYDLGRYMALSLSMGYGENMPLNFPSFIAGAKAALGLGEQIISRDAVERILNMKFADFDSDSGDSEDGYDNKFRDFVGQIDVTPFVPYTVKWIVTACPVAKDNSPAERKFTELLRKFNIVDSRLPCILMAQVDDADSLLYSAITASLKDFKLPDGYEWFCGRRDGTDTMLGIMGTGSAFRAKVSDAMLDFDPGSGIFSVPWAFDWKDALKWAEFTEENIGRHIAMDINGVFMYAPKVNSKITSGHCIVTGLTPSEINFLFQGAVKKE